MFIDKDSIMINNVSFGKYLTSVSYQYPKLWSEDTGRALSGRFNGVLKGVFPKFELNFGPLTKTDVETIVPILDSQYQTFTYYDPNKKATISITTYTGDYDFTMSNKYKAKGLKVSFISVDRRP